MSLALGGLSGWLVLASVEQSPILDRLGVTNPRAFLQLHLDWVMMGLILVAADVAVPDRPGWITATIAVGTVGNPLLFAPLAWSREMAKTAAYRVTAIVSFTAMSGGLVALAVVGLA